jgi:eukaryotic-like serine/threonine-protein kinase
MVVIGSMAEYYGQPMPKKGPEKLGRYKLLALLATGGMAEIYLARQTGIKGFERLVVVKRILPHLARTKRFVEMFFDEARIAAQLSHPNIVQIFDLGQEEDEYFISMEYLEGESLGYLVREARNTGQFLPVHLAAGILAQVCDGLDYAHKFTDETGQPMHIVHRDVSPHNIIVLFSGGVKLVDFGIAKAASQMHQTRVGTMKGKLTYMPPEQCLSQPVDARSDVFSLGIVFWELLTRRRLFKRESEAAMIQAILTEPIPPVREIRPGISPDLEAVVMRALEREKEKRFASAGEMSAAIRKSLRSIGAAAGLPEIARFVNTVFAERARTKRKLLEDIRAAGSGEVSLGALKPETDESLPSRSRADEDSDPDMTEGDRIDAPEIGPDATTRKDARPLRKKLKAKRAKGKQPEKSHLLIPIMLIVVALAGLTTWWVVTREPEAKTTPVDGPQPFGPDAGLVVAGFGPAPIDAGSRDVDAGPGSADESADESEVPSSRPDAGVEVAATRPALLAVISKPSGCRVEVDDIEVPGKTPLEDLAVDPGTRHQVVVLCPRYEKQSKQLSAEPGERVEVEFSPKRLAKATPATGSLRLNTVPWSEVYLGKRKLGITPLLGIKLPVGVHTLTASNQGRGLKKTFKVTIQPGKTTTLRLKLTD